MTSKQWRSDDQDVGDDSGNLFIDNKDKKVAWK